jgi:hypothetical protein
MRFLKVAWLSKVSSEVFAWTRTHGLTTRNALWALQSALRKNVFEPAVKRKIVI